MSQETSRYFFGFEDINFVHSKEAASPQQLTWFKEYNPTQTFFLRRLQRMLKLKQNNPPFGEPFIVKALHKAIFSTVLDCKEQNLTHEAHLILNGKTIIPQTEIATK